MLSGKYSAAGSTDGGTMSPPSTGRKSAEKTGVIGESKPLRLLISTTICVFVGEALIMVFLSILPPLGAWMTVFVDASLIVIIVFPALYMFLFRPMVRDILKRTRTEQAMLKVEARAQRLETIGKLANKVAHDFNNLLSPLTAYPDFIRDKLPCHHPALMYVDKIESAAKKIAGMNQQLLNLSRNAYYKKEIINLNATIRHCVREMGSMPDTLILELDLAEDLHNVLGGSEQLHRALMNLLTNAREATKDAGRISIVSGNCGFDKAILTRGRVPPGQVPPERVPAGEYVRVTVSDTGCGISGDAIQKILDPFFTSKKTNGGLASGLGLSEVDAVLKNHGGYLDISSKVDEGSSFNIYLPIVRESIEEKS